MKKISLKDNVNKLSRNEMKNIYGGKTGDEDQKNDSNSNSK